MLAGPGHPGCLVAVRGDRDELRVRLPSKEVVRVLRTASARCFLELLEAFLELEPDSVLALSFVLLFFDLRVEVLDLLDFFDLVEFFDLRRKSAGCKMLNKRTLCDREVNI